MKLREMFWKGVELAKSAPGAFALGFAIGFFATKIFGL